MLNSEDAQTAVKVCNNNLVFISLCFQLTKAGRYSEERMMQTCGEAQKNFMMELLSTYNCMNEVYDTDPIMTLKFYCCV